MKSPSKKVIIVTGPSGSGKSSVARLFSQKGFRLIKGDEIAKSLYRPGFPVWRKLRQEFGEEYFKGARLDRGKLGRRVFRDPKALGRLNAIVHPALKREILKQLSKTKKACVDMAVYFSAGAPRWNGKIVLVDAPLKLRIKRLMKRGADPQRARSQAQALKFSARQRRVASVVLENKGTLLELRDKVNRLYKGLFNGHAKKP